MSQQTNPATGASQPQPQPQPQNNRAAAVGFLRKRGTERKEAGAPAVAAAATAAVPSSLSIPSSQGKLTLDELVSPGPWSPTSSIPLPAQPSSYHHTQPHEFALSYPPPTTSLHFNIHTQPAADFTPSFSPPAPLLYPAGYQGLAQMERISVMLRRKEEELQLQKEAEELNETTFERKLRKVEEDRRGAKLIGSAPPAASNDAGRITDLESMARQRSERRKTVWRSARRPTEFGEAAIVHAAFAMAAAAMSDNEDDEQDLTSNSAPTRSEPIQRSASAFESRRRPHANTAFREAMDNRMIGDDPSTGSDDAMSRTPIRTRLDHKGNLSVHSSSSSLGGGMVVPVPGRGNRDEDYPAAINGRAQALSAAALFGTSIPMAVDPALPMPILPQPHPMGHPHMSHQQQQYQHQQQHHMQTLQWQQQAHVQGSVGNSPEGRFEERLERSNSGQRPARPRPRLHISPPSFEQPHNQYPPRSPRSPRSPLASPHPHPGPFDWTREDTEPGRNLSADARKRSLAPDFPVRKGSIPERGSRKGSAVEILALRKGSTPEIVGARKGSVTADIVGVRKTSTPELNESRTRAKTPDLLTIRKTKVARSDVAAARFGSSLDSGQERLLPQLYTHQRSAVAQLDTASEPPTPRVAGDRPVEPTRLDNVSYSTSGSVLAMMVPIDGLLESSTYISRSESCSTSSSSIPPLPLLEPSRKFLHQGRAWQVITTSTVKDRYLFLFTDMLVIAKQLSDDPINPLNSTYQIKNIMPLNTTNHNAQLVLKDERWNYTARVPSPAVRTTVKKFGANPIKAIAYILAKRAFPCTPDAIAHFLHVTPGLNKRQLGRFLGVLEHADILQAFLSTFPFKNQRIDESLRLFLSTMRLPGDTAVIDRMLDAFARQWFHANKDGRGHTADLHPNIILRLVFAVMELNADLHNTYPTSSSATSPTTVVEDDTHPAPPPRVTSREFIDRFRTTIRAEAVAAGGYNGVPLPYSTGISTTTLAEVYDSVRREKVEMAEVDADAGGKVGVLVEVAGGGGGSKGEVVYGGKRRPVFHSHSHHAAAEDAYVETDPHHHPQPYNEEDAADEPAERADENEVDTNGTPDDDLTIPPFPSRLTLKHTSPPISISIPFPDPRLRIHLYGQDLLFTPAVLTFATSNTATFTVKGTGLGRKIVFMYKRGGTARRYRMTPATRQITIEPAFLRHSFQLTFWSGAVGGNERSGSGRAGGGFKARSHNGNGSSTTLPMMHRLDSTLELPMLASPVAARDAAAANAATKKKYLFTVSDFETRAAWMEAFAVAGLVPSMGARARGTVGDAAGGANMHEGYHRSVRSHHELHRQQQPQQHSFSAHSHHHRAMASQQQQQPQRNPQRDPAHYPTYSATYTYPTAPNSPQPPPHHSSKSSQYPQPQHHHISHPLSTQPPPTSPATVLHHPHLTSPPPPTKRKHHPTKTVSVATTLSSTSSSSNSSSTTTTTTTSTSTSTSTTLTTTAKSSAYSLTDSDTLPSHVAHRVLKEAVLPVDKVVTAQQLVRSVLGSARVEVLLGFLREGGVMDTWV
ncbi:uncharacterized protein EV422DRAFT_599848 [Fimicolochytrium jonesii]|uniref:uncharacterized protein n=1 Tax=Fimicolochytrium jonesii TaxID=1396493 RepID=UPI0022FDE7E4|nr:uncharacterized protein EV422DRAFT_599848 [Fimicolochytrium jonesii]KAI8825621.1 hypothetical protein EV422DRAFT_599848 [Fimicolochytrium jonesii]